MVQSIEFFDSIVNSCYFRRHAIFLWFTNYASFSNKLSQGFNLSLCFNSNINPNYSGTQWNGNNASINFNPKSDYNSNIDRDNHLNACIHAAYTFIAKRYQEKCRRTQDVYSNRLDIIDDDQLMERFYKARETILMRKLNRHGFLGDFI